MNVRELGQREAMMQCMKVAREAKMRNTAFSGVQDSKKTDKSRMHLSPGASNVHVSGKYARTAKMHSVNKNPNKNEKIVGKLFDAYA